MATKDRLIAAIEMVLENDAELETKNLLSQVWARSPELLKEIEKVTFRGTRTPDQVLKSKLQSLKRLQILRERLNDGVSYWSKVDSKTKLESIQVINVNLPDSLVEYVDQMSKTWDGPRGNRTSALKRIILDHRNIINRD